MQPLVAAGKHVGEQVAGVGYIVLQLLEEMGNGVSLRTWDGELIDDGLGGLLVERLGVFCDRGGAAHPEWGW